METHNGHHKVLGDHTCAGWHPGTLKYYNFFPVWSHFFFSLINIYLYWRLEDVLREEGTVSAAKVLYKGHVCGFFQATHLAIARFFGIGWYWTYFICCFRKYLFFKLLTVLFFFFIKKEHASKTKTVCLTQTSKQLRGHFKPHLVSLYASFYFGCHWTRERSWGCKEICFSAEFLY